MDRFWKFLARAFRAMARSLRRLAKRLKGGAAAAAEVAEDVYEGALEVAHEAIDVAEHVAAVPGAAVAGLLGARAPGPGDIADAAVAADTGPIVPKAPEAKPAFKRAPFVSERMLDLIAGRIGEREAKLPDSVRFWLADMSEDDRQGLARFSVGQLEAHFRNDRMIPGVPRIYSREEVQARYAQEGLPLETALRELRIDALCEAQASAARKRGDRREAERADEALGVSLARRYAVPPEAYVHEAPAMRM